jgi:CDGSH-type Zn-finger protein
VRVRENGPLAFNAPLTVAGKDEGLRLTLCRCGQSKNKPYFDGSHTAAGFTATGELAEVKSEPLAQRNGPVAATPIIRWKSSPAPAAPSAASPKLGSAAAASRRTSPTATAATRRRASWRSDDRRRATPRTLLTHAATAAGGGKARRLAPSPQPARPPIPPTRVAAGEFAVALAPVQAST